MKKYFLTGLVTLLPLAVTIWVVNFVIRLLTNPFIGIVNSLMHKIFSGPLLSETATRMISQLTILIALFLTIFSLGFIARKFFFKQLIRLSDRILRKIPLVNTVYKTSKEIVLALFSSNAESFKQVVLIPFPYKGAYCVGLIARHAPRTCSESQGEEMISVFVPTTPNPTTGFLVICPESELIHLKMTTQDAIKYIVSCGVIAPIEEIVQ
jgi:uncharacterized membrane protein